MHRRVVTVALVAAMAAPILAAPAASASPGDIRTFAGGGVGDGGTATQGVLTNPTGLALDPAGRLLIGDAGHSRVRMVAAGVITTAAGNGNFGFSGDNGPATAATLNTQFFSGLAADGAGNFYVADSSNNRIRRVDAAGTITTVAGNGTFGSGGDGGPATFAELAFPSAVAVDGAGQLYIADLANNRVRRVGTDGAITTVAGNGTGGYDGDNKPAILAALAGPQGVAVDAAGNLFIADTNNQRVRRVGTDGVITTVAGTGSYGFNGDSGQGPDIQLANPTAVAVDAAGNVFVADSGNQRIRKIDPTGQLTTVAGNGTSGFSGDGGPAAVAGFDNLSAVVVDPAGNLFLAETDNNNPDGGRVRRVDALTGIITTVAGGGAGDGSPATGAALQDPYGLAIAAGNTYISENGSNRVRKVAADGRIGTLAGGGTVPPGDGGQATAAVLADPEGVAVDSHGDLFVADGARGVVRRIGADGVITTVAGGGNPPDGIGDGLPATSARLSFPHGVAVDAAGDLFIADIGNHRVRKVGTDGIISTYAGGGSPADGTGDGGPATGASIEVRGIDVDAAGNLYIADVSPHNSVRRVTPAGIITTVAGNGEAGSAGDGGPATQAQLYLPEGVSVDPAGNLYIATIGDNQVRKVDSSGIITTVAGNGTGGFAGDGGPATRAELNTPLDADGTPGGIVVIADTNGNRIRRVDPAGTISTLAGNGNEGFGGDGGPSSAAAVSRPSDVTFDSSGNVFFADTGNGRVRKIDTNGIITTVAGGGVGDGLPATSISLAGPRGLAVDAAGNVLVAECGSGRVRKVTTATGVISTIVGGGSPPGGVGDGGPATMAALVCPTGLLLVSGGGGPAPARGPAAGTLFIADCLDNRVRRVDPTGTITTVAGTGAAGYNGDDRPALTAQLNCPSDVRLDAAGNLFIADRDNNRVRRVDAGGTITTVAGDGRTGFGNERRARFAHVNNPTGLVFDGGGNLIVAESTHARVRKVTPAGTITTVAGTGIPGFSGDGGPAPLATLSGPTQVALDGSGDVLFTDRANQRVRLVEAGSPGSIDVGCGRVITRDTTLTRDLGPCPGDGIVVGADNVTLDLGGHTVAGALGPGDGSHAGIRLTRRTGVTVKNGTVRDFDAGVALFGGSGNTVTHLVVSDNVGPPSGSSPELGDGIAVLFSSRNRVVDNLVLNNGDYDGITALGLDANDNLIKGNTVEGNTGPGIIVNAFLDFNLPGRGGSIHGNDVIGNTVRGNHSAGISNLSNQRALIAGNLVIENGFEDPEPGNGIGIQSLATADPVTSDVVRNNHVFGNATFGIQVITQGNRIVGNVATGNGVDPQSGFGIDLVDFTRNITGVPCDHNTWLGNTWGAFPGTNLGSYDPECVSRQGHGPRPGIASAPPAAAGAAAVPAGASSAAPSPGKGTGGRHLTPADAQVARAVMSAR